jgi:histidine triad (HIT) family protein
MNLPHPVGLMSHNCVFCDITRAHTYDIAYSQVVSFEPLNPVTPGHRLFIPRQHVTDAADEPFVTSQTFLYAAMYAKEQGKPFNLITSCGEDATQSVFHLHVHYVPRFEGDNLHLPWTGQAK